MFGLIRGPNTDGGPCTPIPYTFTLNPDNTFSFVADKGDQKVIVEYTVVWAPVPSIRAHTRRAERGLDPTSEFAWGMSAPVAGDYVVALACVKDDIDLGLGALPVLPNVAPFARQFTSTVPV